MERNDFSYENTYEFSEEIDNSYSDEENDEENETIVGDVTFSADAVWNKALQQYEFQFINWSETSGRFSTDGEAPGSGELESQFIEDFREYLISQGVDRDDIE